MQAKLINGSENPEQLVCIAARNDYLPDGVADYTFTEIMDEVSIDEKHEGRSQIRGKMCSLIDHLIRSGHWGPFEHPQAVIAIEGVTRVVTHQLVRHRHFSYDQQSFRYVGLDERIVDYEEWFDVPEIEEEMVTRDGVVKIDGPDEAELMFKTGYADAVRRYNLLKEQGVPQEIARKVLPMGIKTNIVMSGNARAWMHILNVRDKGDVQGETQEVAKAINEELKEWMPYTFKKYEEDVRPMKLNP